MTSPLRQIKLNVLNDLRYYNPPSEAGSLNITVWTLTVFINPPVDMGMLVLHQLIVPEVVDDPPVNMRSFWEGGGPFLKSRTIILAHQENPGFLGERVAL